MQLYFFAESKAKKIEKFFIENIVRLKERDHRVSYALGDLRYRDVRDPEFQKGHDECGCLLEIMDGVVVDLSEADRRTRFMLSFAILNRVPTLCLHDGKRKARAILDLIRQKNMPPIFTTQPYRWNEPHAAIDFFIKKQTIVLSETKTKDVLLKTS